MRRPRGGRERYRGNYYYRDGQKFPLVKVPDAFALRRDGHAPAGGGEDGLPLSGWPTPCTRPRAPGLSGVSNPGKLLVQC